MSSANAWIFGEKRQLSPESVSGALERDACLVVLHEKSIYRSAIMQTAFISSANAWILEKKGYYWVRERSHEASPKGVWRRVTMSDVALGWTARKATTVPLTA